MEREATISKLKIVSLKKLANGRLTVKETMAITMIDPSNVKIIRVSRRKPIYFDERIGFCSR